MGYFSNGTEGSGYESKYCENCIHYNPHGFCPITDIHQLYNYNLKNGSPGRTILDMLIPRSKGKLWNEQCKMFIQIKSEGQEEF